MFVTDNRGFMTQNGQPDNPRAARYILKDFVNGKLLYCHGTPGFDQSQYHVYPERSTDNQPRELPPAAKRFNKSCCAKYRQHPLESASIVQLKLRALQQKIKMADGSEPVIAPYENPAGAPPINARPYDFGALTPSQQGALNRLKLRMLRDDQTYLAEHPQANIQHVYNTLSLDSGAGGYFNVQEWVAHMLFSGVGGVVSLLLREVCHAKPRRAHEFMANHVAKPTFNAELEAYLNDKISADRNCDRPGVSCPVCVPPTSDASPGAGQRDEPTETRWQSSTTTTAGEPEEVQLPEGDEYSPRDEDNVVEEEEEEEEEELNLEGFLGRRESDHDGVRVWRHHAKRADLRFRRSLDGEPVGGARRPSLGVRARRDSGTRLSRYP
uniref:Uncharacterized protein n=1 Tax=Timema shepardi TaxID=629360 RepID=A0A7R9AXK3_TIMSH|nr:unnamed protein product [Timema shepardi]